MQFTDIIKTILFGILEGITEWLPVSSTGHMILLDSFLKMAQPKEFMDIFMVVIQLGAVLAVVLCYWDRLWPFSPRKNARQRHNTWGLWIRIIAGTIPAVIAGLLLDDIVEEKLSTPMVIGIMLMLYGVLYVLIERGRRGSSSRIRRIQDMDLKTVLIIGLFQCLALIPGTSRSGITILSALMLGCSRSVSAEFSFFLAIPVICGASLLKLVRYGFDFTGAQALIMILGVLVAFLVSMSVIRRLLAYIKRHDFSIFGYYRIILGILVLLRFYVLK